MKIGSLIALACMMLFSLPGCGSGNDMTKDEIAKGMHSKPPSDEQRRMVMNSMAEGGKTAVQLQSDWAKAHPDKIASVNAQRAKSGLPPLGQ